CQIPLPFRCRQVRHDLLNLLIYMRSMTLSEGSSGADRGFSLPAEEQARGQRAVAGAGDSGERAIRSGRARLQARGQGGGRATMAEMGRGACDGVGMPLADFVHLRVHTAYSLSAGAIRVKELVGLCQAARMPAVAVTDTGNLFGALEVATSCAAAGIQ